MQPSYETRLTALALTALPLTVQKILAQHPDENVRCALSYSTLTHIDVIDQLVTDKNFLVKRAAYCRTTNRDALNKAVKAGMPHKTGRQIQLAVRAACNPLTAPELLVDALDATNRSLALRAYCNPATPEHARRKLTSGAASWLLATAKNGEGHKVRVHAEDYKVRAFELVSANPWMLGDPLSWDGYIVGAITGMPATTKSMLDAIITSVNQQNKAYNNTDIHDQNRYTAGIHPAYNNDHIHDMAIDDLLAAGSAAGDIEAMGRNTFTENDARNIINRDLWPESHIIGRLVNRYGAAILYGNEMHTIHWGQERFKAAQWVASAVGFADGEFFAHVQDMRDASDMLGDVTSAWETYVALLPDWHGTYVTGARCALRL